MKFMFLGIMSAESVSNMHATSHDKRRKMAEIVAAGAGGNVLDMMFCQGVYDMVAVWTSRCVLSDRGEGAVLASGAYSTVDILSEFDLIRQEGRRDVAIARSVRVVWAFNDRMFTLRRWLWVCLVPRSEVGIGDSVKALTIGWVGTLFSFFFTPGELSDSWKPAFLAMQLGLLPVRLA